MSNGSLLWKLKSESFEAQKSKCPTGVLLSYCVTINDTTPFPVSSMQNNQFHSQWHEMVWARRFKFVILYSHSYRDIICLFALEFSNPVPGEGISLFCGKAWIKLEVSYPVPVSSFHSFQTWRCIWKWLAWDTRYNGMGMELASSLSLSPSQHY